MKKEIIISCHFSGDPIAKIKEKGYVVYANPERGIRIITSLWPTCETQMCHQVYCSHEVVDSNFLHKIDCKIVPIIYWINRKLYSYFVRFYRKFLYKYLQPSWEFSKY